MLGDAGRGFPGVRAHAQGPASRRQTRLLRVRQELEQATGSDGLGELIGIEYQGSEADEVRARVEVGDHIRQPFGIVHGGVYAALAESICSAATWLAVRGDGMVAMGQSNSATFLRPITEGHVNAVAQPPAPGPHDLGLGRGDERRRGAHLRPGTNDHCGPPG